MLPTFADIAELALGLPVEKRQRLVILLLDSIPDAPQSEIDAAWAAEIERRVADLENGKARLVPCSDVRAELDRLLSEG